MKKVTVFTILAILLIAFSGCNNDTEETAKTDEIKNATEITDLNEKSQNNNNVLSFYLYQELSKEVQKELKIDDYSYKDSSEGIDAVRIDENLSFGNREWLTKDGNLSSPLESTQEMFFYENRESTRLLTITLAYTDDFIGNDMILYNTSSGYDINEELIRSESIVLSYKNLVVSIVQNSKVDLEMEETQNAALAIIDYLQKY